MVKKDNPSFRKEVLEKIRIKHRGNDVGTQCNRMLEAMQTLGSISTIEAHRYLDILHPPARKLNLLQHGHIVELIWVHEPSDCGEIHRVGKYVYMGKTSYPLFDNLNDGETT
jgi:hypothetical protein